MSIRRLPDLLLSLFFAVLILFAGSTTAYSQSGTRSFQMGLWTDLVPAHSDIAIFLGGIQPQPVARSIFIQNGANLAPLTNVSNINWSTIVAVEYDEPYAFIDGSLKVSSRPDCANADFVQLTATDTQLSARAAELKALNPKARFWVNFTNVEANWMVTCADVGSFNRAYIDVISADWSPDGANNSIVGITPFYSIVAAYRSKFKPDQQLALVPGVYSSPVDQTQHLQGFFDYANDQNLTCNLPLGVRGITGIFDGCPVWVVMGWLSDTITDHGTTYVGMLDSRSASVRNKWDAELALPLTPSLSHQPAPSRAVPPMLQLLLH